MSSKPAEIDPKEGISAEVAGKLFEGLLFPDPAPKPGEGEPSAEEPITTEGTEPEAEPVASEPEADEPQLEPGEEAPPTRSRKVKVSGKEFEVTEDEAYQGYMRQSDYTQKTQRAAEVVKAAEAESEKARVAREEYFKALAEVKNAMDALVPGEPDWVSLKGSLTPEQFASAHTEYTLFKRQYDKVVSEQTKVQEQRNKDYEAQVTRYLNDQAEKLLTAKPEWRDENVAAKARAEMREFASKRMGMSDEEIASISDHRQVMAIHDAMQWHKLQLQRKGAQPARSKLRSAPSGGSLPSTRPSANTDKGRAMDRLAKTGRTEDAAKAFMHIKGLTD